MSNTRASFYRRQSQGMAPPQSEQDIAETINFLQILRFDISREELERPTPKVMAAFMEHIVDQLVGLTPEMISERVHELFADRPEMISEWEPKIRETVMFHAFHDLLRLSRTPEMTGLTIANITKPDVATFRAIVNAVIEFAQFRDHQGDVNDILASMEASTDRDTKAEEDLVQAQAEYNEINRIVQSQSSDLDQCEHYNYLLSQELLKVKDTADVLVQQCEDFKRDKRSLTNDIQLKQNELEQLLLDVRELESYQNFDHDAELREIEALEEDIAHLEQETAAFSEQKQRYISMQRQLQIPQAHFQILLNEVNEYQKLYEDATEAKQDNARSQSDLRRLENELLRLRDQAERHEKHLKSTNEKLNRFKEQYEQRKRDDDERSRQEEREHSRVLATLDQEKLEIEKLERDTAELEAIANDEMHLHNRQLGELDNMLLKLINAVNNHWVPTSESFEKAVKEMVAVNPSEPVAVTTDDN